MIRFLYPKFIKLSGIVMISEKYAKVGSKGEFYLPKKFREALGLSPNSRIRYYISPKGYLIIEKVISVEDLLKTPSIARVSTQEIEALSETIQKHGEKEFD